MIKVLIVEDDPMVAKLNSMYLDKVDGFKLSGIAKSLDEALSILKKHKIDLILLDIFLPNSNGIELLKKLREADNSVNVIIISAASDVSTIKKAMSYGVRDYLIKPFEFDRFNKALLSYKETINYIGEKSKLNQKEIDSHLLGRDIEKANALPKGLNKITLIKIWKNIKTLRFSIFSTEEIAEIVGISRVSMRKYLEFLKDIQVLDMEIEYGSIGRPIYKYKYTEQNDNFLNNYK